LYKINAAICIPITIPTKNDAKNELVIENMNNRITIQIDVFSDIDLFMYTVSGRLIISFFRSKISFMRYPPHNKEKRENSDIKKPYKVLSFIKDRKISICMESYCKNTKECGNAFAQSK